MESIVDTEVHPGQILAGKFRIERILGRGGMGVVVAATHIQLDEKVALKFLLPEALKNEEAVRRFEREARAAVKIKSEHVARVTDVGKLETGAPYMVMEFLHGMDLGEYLKKMGPLPLEEAVEYLLQASEAIAEAHSLGIIHRDLKPANLYRIVRSDGSPSVKVLDFGISKVTNGSDASMTHTSSMMGSPYYMSPEQMTSAKNVDQRTDVWALGIILHELLTGRVPYDGETIPEVCAKVLQNPAPELSALRQGLPNELNFVLAKALAKAREDRFDDVAQLAAALAAFTNADGQRSIERISRVLGVENTARPSLPTGLEGTALAAPYEGGLSPSSSASGTGAGLVQASTGIESQPTTLGGAAHTQLDYSPPTTGINRKVLVAGAVGIVLLGGGIFALTGNNDQDAIQESLVAAEGDTADSSAQEPVDEIETTPTRAGFEKKHGGESDGSSPQPAAEAAADEKAKNPPQPADAAKAPGPSKSNPGTATSSPTPAPQPKPPAPAPSPRASTPPPPVRAAAPAPAAAPRPTPLPNPSSLYLDRR